jgi:hypothetical protein
MGQKQKTGKFHGENNVTFQALMELITIKQTIFI